VNRDYDEKCAARGGFCDCRFVDLCLRPAGGWRSSMPNLPKPPVNYVPNRISRDQMLIDIAFIVARRSTCARGQVGAVIADEGRIVSTGYGGAPARMPHCSSTVCDLTQPCTRTVHAEANAIAWAARSAIAIEACTLYCTHSPCLDCAKLIINSGIKRVVYGQAYRKTDGTNLLESVGIDHELLLPESQLRTLPGVGVGGVSLPVGSRSKEEAPSDDHRGVPE
jgi:dCMP deaminase